MDVWTGSISVESGSPSLQDLRLSTPSSAPVSSSVSSHLSSSLSSARLSLISLIDPTRIPLFLAAGPSLELTTTSSTTASYFRKLFLSGIPASANDVTDGRTVEQSRIALLVRVTNDESPTDGSWGVTELAIYGAVTHLPPLTLTGSPQGPAELTPPNSSPAADIPSPRATVTVHALPLSSHHAFLSHLPSTKPEPQSPALELSHALVRLDASENDAVFIAPNPQDVLNPSISHSAKKRGAAVLDAAADPRKRAKRSAVPPRLPPPLSLLGGTGLNRKVQTEPRSRGVMVKRERSPSPSPSFAPSMGSKRSFNSGSNRHSVLKRRESTVIETPREGSVRPVSSSSSAIKKEVYGEVETRNRTELAKMVVTGMKACGLRDYRNNRGKSVVQAGEEDGDGGREREREKEREKEEYKQVYHHTVKAVAFAYRNVISLENVDTEKMRETVERLLGMFCEPKPGQLLLEAAATAAPEGC